MFEYFTNRKTKPLDAQIAAILRNMEQTNLYSEEYSKLMTNLERLYELKGKTRKAPVSRDTLVIVGGNLLLALGIVAYEQKHIVTSKAFGQIIRPKGT